MKEIWRSIEGYENYYEVSNLGRVRSLDRVVQRGKREMEIEGKIIKGCSTGQGYLSLNLCKGGRRQPFKISRLVALAFIPNPGRKETVDHINNIKTDNRAVNLQWLSRRENSTLAAKEGCYNPVKGKNHHNSKLTEKDVLGIRELFSTGNYTKVSIAKAFNITPSNVGGIIKQKFWRHV